MRRELKFPTDKSAGTLYTWNHGKNRWEHLARARNIVTVPADAHLLYCIDLEWKGPLAFLADVEPGAIQALDLNNFYGHDDNDQDIFESFRHLHGVVELNGVSESVLIKLLRHLDTSGLIRLTVDRATDSTLQHIGNIPSLRELVLTRSTVTDSGLAHLHGLKNLVHFLLPTNVNSLKGEGMLSLNPGIQRLLLKDVDDGGVTWLGHFGQLRDLIADKWLSERGLLKLQDPKLLHILSAAKTALNDDALSTIERCPELEFLDISETSISDAGLHHLRNMRSLGDLNLGRTQINGEGLNHLTDLAKLERLNLAGCKLSPQGLSNLAQLTQLKFLDLISADISDVDITRLRNLRGLCFLDLYKAKANASQIDDLQQALPDCQVRTQ